MPVSSERKNNKVSARDKTKKSRAALEQDALEGRSRDIYRFVRKELKWPDSNFLNDLTLLRLSWLWLYCDPKKELTIDQFMDLTENQMHERFDELPSKGHLQKLDTFEKVIHLYALEDDCVKMPYRRAQ